jgi:hypothetical protein
MSGGVAGVLLTGSALKGSVMAKWSALQEKLQSKSMSKNAYSNKDYNDPESLHYLNMTD